MWNDGELCGYLDQRRRVTADATSTRDIELKTSSVAYADFNVVLIVLLTVRKDRGRKREGRRGSSHPSESEKHASKKLVFDARKFREETSL